MTKQRSKVAKAILEMADDQRRSGLLSETEHKKITIRHLGKGAPRAAEPITAEQIRTLRIRENLSQAVFARCLNLTVGYVSQLERGTRQPKGAALTLLNIVRHKGLQAIL